MQAVCVCSRLFINRRGRGKVVVFVGPGAEGVDQRKPDTGAQLREVGWAPGSEPCRRTKENPTDGTTVEQTRGNDPLINNIKMSEGCFINQRKLKTKNPLGLMC